MRVEPYILTKLDIAAIRAADCLVVQREYHSTGHRRVELSKRKPEPTPKCPYPQESHYDLNVPVDVSGGTWEDRERTEGARCSAVVNLYGSQRCEASSILATLRVGDGIVFRFYADKHTNGYVAAAGLHGDVLDLEIHRAGRQVATFEIGTSIAPDNSARMCQVGKTARYMADAARMRSEVWAPPVTV